MNKKNMHSKLSAIGVNLKKERLEHHMSLDDLALASGVSKAMLSQIETGKVNPTVLTMWKISQVLNIDFNVLLKGGDGPKIMKFDVRRSSDLPVLAAAGKGVSIIVLSPVSMADELELYLINMKSGAVLDSDPHLAGTEEFVTVLKGEVKVSSGGRSSILKEGDIANYQCDVQHSIENISRGESRLHLLVRFKSNHPLA